MLLRASVGTIYSGLRASRRVCRSLGGSFLCDCSQCSRYLFLCLGVYLSFCLDECKGRGILRIGRLGLLLGQSPG